MSDAAENTPPPPPSGLTGRQLLQAMKDNFVLMSGVVVILGVGLATIFLYSYLSVFDWHLIWFVQYADILTFGLIAVGLIGGSLIFLQSLAQSLLNVFSFSKESKRRWLIGAGFCLLGIIAFNINDAVRHSGGYFHILFGTLTLAVGVVLILVAVSHIRAGGWPNAVQATFSIILVIIATSCLGTWLAYSVSETSEFDQDVTLKDQILSGAKLIIVMSRHTILLKDKVLYVVPTADIIQFRTADKR
jgi:hypothetical protein